MPPKGNNEDVTYRFASTLVVSILKTFSGRCMTYQVSLPQVPMELQGFYSHDSENGQVIYLFSAAFVCFGAVGFGSGKNTERDFEW